MEACVFSGEPQLFLTASTHCETHTQSFTGAFAVIQSGSARDRLLHVTDACVCLRSCSSASRLQTQLRLAPTFLHPHNTEAFSCSSFMKPRLLQVNILACLFTLKANSVSCGKHYLH